MHGGMEIDQAKKYKEPEQENALLKKLIRKRPSFYPRSCKLGSFNKKYKVHKVILFYIEREILHVKGYLQLINS